MTSPMEELVIVTGSMLEALTERKGPEGAVKNQQQIAQPEKR